MSVQDENLNDINISHFITILYKIPWVGKSYQFTAFKMLMAKTLLAYCIVKIFHVPKITIFHSSFKTNIKYLTGTTFKSLLKAFLCNNFQKILLFTGRNVIITQNTKIVSDPLKEYCLFYLYDNYIFYLITYAVVLPFIYLFGMSFWLKVKEIPQNRFQSYTKVQSIFFHA